uniref:Ovule protein n=1 Tax=Romanomermis culicivorax TaxID=13658 RepID=A0A915JYF2_ROMCU
MQINIRPWRQRQVQYDKLDFIKIQMFKIKTEIRIGRIEYKMFRTNNSSSDHIIDHRHEL